MLSARGGRYINTLGFIWDGKDVPYPEDEIKRTDGEKNNGFVALKGCTTLAMSIPELVTDPALCQAVINMNSAKTGIFTIGCTSGMHDREGSNRYRWNGYVEFAVNSKSQIPSSEYYFRLFSEFDRLLNEAYKRFLGTYWYNWDLRPVCVITSEVHSGYSCDISINTDWVEDKDIAQRCWSEAVGFLGIGLSRLARPHHDPIY